MEDRKNDNVEKVRDDCGWVGEKAQLNGEISGSPRKIYLGRASRHETLGVEHC